MDGRVRAGVRHPQGPPDVSGKRRVGAQCLSALYVTKAIYEGQRSTTDRKRVVIFTRSAFTGQQRNAAISWSGDISANWITFQRQIPAGLNFSMSGLPYWTTDGGGFFRPKDQYTDEAYHELLIRWFQYAAFCPIFRVHGMDFECRDLELRLASSRHCHPVR